MSMSLSRISSWGLAHRNSVVSSSSSPPSLTERMTERRRSSWSSSSCPMDAAGWAEACGEVLAEVMTAVPEAETMSMDLSFPDISSKSIRKPMMALAQMAPRYWEMAAFSMLPVVVMRKFWFMV